jgi:sigma-B regulation protein RsbU (phosphoserine phosphatase)
MFVTMFVGILNLTDNSFRYCNAGHCPGVIASDSGCEYMNVVPNLPLGVISDFSYQEQSTVLLPGSVLLFYTDGLTEAENAQHELLGDELVIETLHTASKQSAKEVVEALKHCVENHAAGTDQSDDLTLFCIKCNSMLKLSNDVLEVEKLPNFVAQSMSHLAIDEEIRDQKATMLNLALEEAVVNVINYAYPDGEKGDIVLTAELHDDSVVYTLIDSGMPFDPTAVATPDLQASVEDRNVGGLGIHLVRNIMTSVAYRRVDTYNELTMISKQ